MSDLSFTPTTAPVATPPAIITLAQLHARTNIPTAATADDPELQDFIDAVTGVVEFIVGPVSVQTFTEYHDGGAGTIILDQRPIVAVTSLTEYAGSTGTVLAARDIAVPVSGEYLVKAEAGLLVRYASGSPAAFTAGSQNIKVVYTAGWTVLPAIKEGALEIARVAFQGTQLGGAPGPTADDVAGGEWIMGFLVNRKAAKWLAPYAKPPTVG